MQYQYSITNRGYSFVAPVKELLDSDATTLEILPALQDEHDPIIGREEELEMIGSRFINGASRQT